MMSHPRRSRRQFLATAGGLALAAAGGCASRERPPNVVIIFTDDQGYADLGVYGAQGFSTPHLDRMAAEGIRFSNFYVAAPICSPSRAALLTGCYPKRVGITGVIGQREAVGISPGEKLLPEILREQGYRTALYGKWHLGRQREFLPLQHGFDEFFGTPGSNDMGANMDLEARRAGKAGVELIEGNETVEINPDQSRLTAMYTERSLRFIRQNRDRPFFLYLAHNMPHTPLFVSQSRRGVSRRGLYGDVIEEIDWSAGRVLDALHREGIDRQTLVFFTSDNGPWLIFGDHGGSAGPLRGGKKQTFEGGMRVPAIARWPGRIVAGRVSHEVVTAMDILPTVSRLAGGQPPDHPIDGRDIWPLLAGAPGAASPHEAFFYYFEDELRGVRSGKWKLQLPHLDRHSPDPEKIGHGGVRGGIRPERRQLALFDLNSDPGETKDLAERHPDVVRRLLQFAERAREDLGDAIAGKEGRNVRPAGKALS